MSVSQFLEILRFSDYEIKNASDEQKKKKKKKKRIKIDMSRDKGCFEHEVEIWAQLFKA